MRAEDFNFRETDIRGFRIRIQFVGWCTTFKCNTSKDALENQ